MLPTRTGWGMCETGPPQTVRKRSNHPQKGGKRVQALASDGVNQAWAAFCHAASSAPKSSCRRAWTYSLSLQAFFSFRGRRHVAKRPEYCQRVPSKAELPPRRRDSSTRGMLQRPGVGPAASEIAPAPWLGAQRCQHSGSPAGGGRNLWVWTLRCVRYKPA